jgi:hypothetical protein
VFAVIDDSGLITMSAEAVDREPDSGLGSTERKRFSQNRY